MRSRLIALLTLSLLAGGVSACADATSDDASSPSSKADQAPIDEAKLSLTTDTIGDTDIAGMRFEVEQVACSNPPFDQAPPNPVSQTKTTDFEDMYLPGELDGFKDQPYDSDSKHIFADQFFYLPAGCYDVTTTPLNAKGAASDECRQAEKSEIRVKDGETTERQLINQCPGAPRGGLDVVSTVNHEPEFQVDGIEYKPSKFAQSCWPTQVCATAKDPDGDPLEFVWEESSSSPGLLSGPDVVSRTENQDGSITECVDIKQEDTGRYDLNVEVYDLAFDDNQNMVRIEELLQQQEEPGNTRSRDDQELRFYGQKACPDQGKTVTIAMVMDNSPGVGASDGRALSRNAVDWINDTSIDPNEDILLVAETNGRSEHPNTPQWVKTRLENSGLTNVDTMAEPQGGLELNDLRPYQNVWFEGGGFPMDDKQTFETLLQYRDQIGGGLILSGDDIAHAASGSGIADMEPLTFLEYQNDNGAIACGRTTDNNQGNNYSVQLDSNNHPVLNGSEGDIRGLQFPYGNDLDRSIRAQEGETFLGGAGFSSGQCSVDTDVVVATDPANLAP